MNVSSKVSISLTPGQLGPVLTGSDRATRGARYGEYVCEILSVVVIVALSALSHFWYLAVGLGVVAVATGAMILTYRLFLRALASLRSKLSSVVLVPITDRR